MGSPLQAMEEHRRASSDLERMLTLLINCLGFGSKSVLHTLLDAFLAQSASFSTAIIRIL